MIIGIAGTQGAGKGTVVEYLISKRGFKHFSMSGFITEEVVRRGMPVNRTSMSFVGSDLRKLHHPAYVMEKLLERAKEAEGSVVIEALRAVSEVTLLKSAGGILIAVDAERDLRYERAILRGSEKDNVTFEEFCEIEDRELRSNDPTEQNILGVVAMADYRIENNGTLEELHTQIDKLFAQGAFD